MVTIFLVTLSDYDYSGTHSAWSTREAAEIVVELLNKSEEAGNVSIEEIDLLVDPSVMKPTYRVTYSSYGEQIKVVDKKPYPRFLLSNIEHAYTNDGTLYVDAYGSTPDEAKAALKTFTDIEKAAGRLVPTN